MNLRQLGPPSLMLCAALEGCAGFPDEARPAHAIVDNRYPGAVVNRAYWQAVSFDDPIPPGASSVVLEAVPSSANRAYVLLAPASAPTSLVVLQSRVGFDASLGHTTRIPVDDGTFAGNCAAGSPLTQAEADFITQLVFARDFAHRRYDAATCTTTEIGDAGAP